MTPDPKPAPKPADADYRVEIIEDAEPDEKAGEETGNIDKEGDPLGDNFA